MTIIAMTDELGAFGIEVASGVARTLQLEYFDQLQIEHEVADSLHISYEALRRVMEGFPSPTERWTLGPERLSQHFSKIFHELASRGDTLIRCVGAAAMLQPISHVMCVRLHAPVELRERVVMKRLHYGHACMARWDIENDASNLTRCSAAMLAGDWRNPDLYDLELDTGTQTVDHCVDRICDAAQVAKFQETLSSRRKLDDMLRKIKADTEMSAFAVAGSDVLEYATDSEYLE